MKKTETDRINWNRYKSKKMELIKHFHWVTGKPDRYQGVRKFAQFGIGSNKAYEPAPR